MGRHLPIAAGDVRRVAAKQPSLLMKNRFFEQNPILSPAVTSVVSRPATKKWIEVGTGHIRRVFSEQGTFNNDAFIASGLFLHRVDYLGAQRSIGQISTFLTSSVSMAAAANLGRDAPERLFITDGGILWVYVENGQARGHLEVTGQISDNDTVTIDDIVYKFTAAGVDVGTPDGTVANPWLVKHTGVESTDLESLFKAINDTGDAGLQYSTALIPHDTVRAYKLNNLDLYVSAVVFGVAGNAIITTETSAGLAWENGGTLWKGGEELLRQVQTPEGEGAVDVAHINSYIIVIPLQGGLVNGRFYWIEPGATDIDPLNYATAERSPDAVNNVIVFSNMFWLCGETTTEPWLTTGDPDAPMRRFEGVLYDRGCWEGTAVKVKDSLIVCDQDGAVFQISGGLKRISRPDIEERIRKAIAYEESI